MLASKAASPAIFPQGEDLPLPTTSGGLLVFLEDPIHFGDFVQNEEAAPEDSSTGGIVVFATQVATELGDPKDRFAEFGCLLRWLGCAVRAAVQGPPFERLQ